MWVLTVSSVMPRLSATILFELPAATPFSTSSSRSVRGAFDRKPSLQHAETPEDALLRTDVVLESAHDLGYGDVLESALAKQPRRGGLDGLVVGLGLRFGYSGHRFLNR